MRLYPDRARAVVLMGNSTSYAKEGVLNAASGAIPSLETSEIAVRHAACARCRKRTTAGPCFSATTRFGNRTASLVDTVQRRAESPARERPGRHPCPLVVACGVSEDAFDVMATGRSRNAA